LDHQFQLELVAVETVMVKVETLHLEQTVSHSIWLHTVEDQLKEMDNQEAVAQEQTILQVLALVEEAKALGRTHGALAEAAEAQAELDIMED
jgi:hypothetical protein